MAMNEVIKDFRLRERVEKLSKIEGSTEKLNLIYMWVKQGVVNRNEFLALISSVKK